MRKLDTLFGQVVDFATLFPKSEQSMRCQPAVGWRYGESWVNSFQMRSPPRWGLHPQIVVFMTTVWTVASINYLSDNVLLMTSVVARAEKCDDLCSTMTDPRKKNWDTGRFILYTKQSVLVLFLYLSSLMFPCFLLSSKHCLWTGFKVFQNRFNTQSFSKWNSLRM